MLDILTYPDERLKTKSVPVTEFDAKLHRQLDEMAKTMYHAKGVGLAAPQVADFRRFFVIDLGEHDEENPNKLYEFINPKLSDAAGSISYEEGCLSVPGYTEKVSRKAKVTVNYQDRHGKALTMNVTGLLAVAIQHENDHLDGILFVDRLSLIKRRLLKNKLKKAVTL